VAGKEDWRKMTLSSGVTVLYGPFPHGLYWDIMARALDDYPDPEPPKKEIEVLGGTEEVDDEDDPDYKLELGTARAKRAHLMGEAALEFCVEVVEPEDWERLCDRVAAKYAKEQPPEDPDEKRAWFLAKYAIRTKEDWDLVRNIQKFSQIEEKEVEQRAEFFRGEVEGAEDPGADAPGAAEE
jgi:hypothetical protein